MSRRWFAVVLGGLLAGCTPAPEWTGHERTVLRSLSLDALPPARDPSNRVAHDPAAIELGRALFHDVRLSANGAPASAVPAEVPKCSVRMASPLAVIPALVVARTRLRTSLAVPSNGREFKLTSPASLHSVSKIAR